MALAISTHDSDLDRLRQRLTVRLETLRGQVATQLSRVQASLDAMLVDRPRRRILRNAPATGGVS